MVFKPDPRGISARKRFTTHGATLFGLKSATWITWCNMRQRCRNKNRPDYHRYGGRGITVCKRWGRFENFLSDMGEKPNRMTLERINNDGSYFPSNCKWASRKEQRLNQATRIHMITFQSITLSLKDWSRRLGWNYGGMSNRFKRGWSVIRMLTEPPFIGKNQTGIRR